MTVEAHSDTYFIAAPIRSTSVTPRIGVDTRLKPTAVDIIHKRTQAVREACGMNKQFAILIATAKEAIVYVYVIVATIVETELHHSIGLRLYDGFANLEAVCIPRAPPHQRGIHGNSHHRCRTQHYAKYKFFHNYIELRFSMFATKIIYIIKDYLPLCRF